jgi:hypothetical protein
VLNEDSVRPLNGQRNAAHSRGRAPSRPHRPQQRIARAHPYARPPTRPQPRIPDSIEDLDLRDALNTRVAADLRYLLAWGDRDRAHLNHEGL